jgi:hypothetical protein
MLTRKALAAVLVLGLVPAAASLAQPAPTGSPLDPRIEKLLAAVSADRLQQLLQRLSSFKTRNTLSDPSAPDGIGAARQWILEEMQRSSPRLQVSFDTHIIPPAARIPKETELRNVVAILPGKTARRIYVSGHYDSLNLGERGQAGFNAGAGRQGGAPPAAGAQPSQGQRQGQPRPPADPNVVAPGANDDGSGTVLTMELARIFADSGIEFDATLVFIAVAGEEQGLVGSTAHAKKAKASNVPIQAVFNNDIVGNSTGGNGIADGSSVRIYSEGPEDSPSRALAQFTRRVAAVYVPSHTVRLIARRDRFSRGGDHTGYNSAGFAAIGFRESRENYSKQHNARDTIDGVSFPYLAQNARVNAAAMATLALAPPPPAVAGNMISRQPSGYDARLRWTASPGAAGYRIFWREAWAPDWERELFVGNVTEYIFPNMNIDDHVFGVAAVSAGGHESTISAYVMAPRADDDR